MKTAHYKNDSIKKWNRSTAFGEQTWRICHLKYENDKTSGNTWQIKAKE
jgi:hypothetical protein